MPGTAQRATAASQYRLKHQETFAMQLYESNTVKRWAGHCLAVWAAALCSAAAMGQDCNGNMFPDDQELAMSGLVGEYFDNPDLQGPPVATRLDPQFYFDPSEPSTPVFPPAGVPEDHFSARWSGFLITPPGETGEYTFRIQADDGYRVWLDGQLLFDEWHLGPTLTNASITLRGDRAYPFTLEYFENNNTQGIGLLWKLPSQTVPPWPLVPSGRFVSDLDTNGNGVPDACDIADGLLADCNGNGIADDQEIAGNDVQDCNGNGIPDDCEAGGVIPIRFPLNADAGWTMEGEWDFGQPQGLGGDMLGYPDPAWGHTGPNVYGVNLAGDYANSPAGGPYYLTSGPIDCSDLEQVTLRFWRWLNCGSSWISRATVEVSNDAINWTVVFENTDPVLDAGWTQQVFDISGVADLQGTVYVRWGHELLIDGLHPRSGWNIDDIEISGIAVGNDCNGNGLPDDCERGGGLLGEYYMNRTFDGEPFGRRIDGPIYFDWASDPGVSGIVADKFAVRWSGFVRTPDEVGDYIFRTRTDDGVRLWVDGQPLIDAWQLQAATWFEGSITLDANTTYPIVLEYFEGVGGAIAELHWNTPAMSNPNDEVVVPSAALSPWIDCNTNGVADECELSRYGLVGQYFGNANLAGAPATSYISDTIDFAWVAGNPTGVGNDNFSARWSGFVQPDVTGDYVFVTRSDDGVRLWVDGVLVIDQWVPQSLTEHQSAPIHLDAGSLHTIVMEYFELSGHAHAQLLWLPPGVGTPEILPELNLLPGLDCNANGTPDDCDIASGLETDCNLNGIPDACDVASGAGFDCNANGWLDECELAPDAQAIYQLDDGGVNKATGAGRAAEMLWLQRFDATDGPGYITAVQATWGWPGSTSTGVEPNEPVRVFVWDDPDDDGVPDDMIFLAEGVAPADPVAIGTGELQTIELPHAARVSGAFFVGAAARQEASGQFPVPVDTSIPSDLAFYAIRTTIDPHTIVPGQASAGFVLRAVGRYAVDCDANGVPDECDADCNNNGIADACEPDLASATDLDDIAGCLSGPDTGTGAGCTCLDVDADGSITLADFASLQTALSLPPQ
jgi:hypothetical protein